MAKAQENKAKIAVIGFRFADYNNNRGQKVTGWYITYLLPSWDRLPDGTQQLKYEAKTTLLAPQFVPTDIGLGIWECELTEQSVFTKYGSAHMWKPARILGKVSELGINLL